MCYFKLLFFIFLGITFPSHAWSQTVHGTVTDSETGDLLTGATILQQNSERGTSSESDGSFSFVLLSDREPVIEVSFIGYITKIIRVRFDDLPLDIRLEPSAIRGDEVFVNDVRATETTPITQTTIQRVDIEKDNIGQDPIFTMEKLAPSMLTHSDAGTRFANYSYLRLRGMDQTRINMTLNGVPLNDMIDQGVFFSNFNDFGNSIQSVQIQRGVGTSTNGTASYAGSVNFESQYTLLDESAAAVKLTGGAFNSHRISTEIQTGLMNKFAFYTRFSNTGSDGYRFHSGTEANSFFGTGGYFGDKNIVKITAFIGKTENELAYTPVPINLIKQQPRTNTVSENDEDIFGQEFFQFQYARTLNNQVSFTSTLYYGGAGGDFPVGFPGAGGEFLQQVFSLENDHYGFKSSVQYTQENGFEISGGLHTYRFDRVNEEFFAPESENLFYQDDSRKDEFSTFIKASYRTGDIEIYGDVQLRIVSLDLNPDTNFLLDAGVPQSQTNTPTRSWTFVSPKIGATYYFSDQFNIYGSFGRSGREPTRQDILGSTNINASNIQILRDENSVRAEYVNDYEGGVRYQAKSFSGKLNGFLMRFTDEISPTGDFIPEGFVQLRENISNSYRTGIELEWKWRVAKAFEFSGNSTWMKTNIDEFSPSDSDETFRNVESILSPEWLGNATISYKPIEWGEISFSGRYMGEAFLELTNQPEFVLPSFITADLSLGARVNQFVSASIQVNNLFDKLHFTNGAPIDTNFDGNADTAGFIVQPPRHLFFELKIDL